MNASGREIAASVVTNASRSVLAASAASRRCAP
jgi:hypothetical protein